MVSKLLVLALILSTALPCDAFKNGYYQSVSDKDEKSNPNLVLPQIFNTAKLADKTLFCESLDKIDIGIGKREDYPEGAPLRYPIYFKREEIYHFLKDERHKDLLVAWFEMPMTSRSTDIKRELAEFKKFISGCGYKRILVLGRDNWGVSVLYDTSEPKE